MPPHQGRGRARSFTRARGACAADKARENRDEGDNDNHHESAMEGEANAFGGNVWVVGGAPPTVISGTEFMQGVFTAIEQVEQLQVRKPSTCFYCGQVGHIARQCTHRRNTVGVSGPQALGQKGQRTRGRTYAMTSVAGPSETTGQQEQQLDASIVRGISKRLSLKKISEKVAQSKGGNSTAEPTLAKGVVIGEKRSREELTTSPSKKGKADDGSKGKKAAPVSEAKKKSALFGDVSCSRATPSPRPGDGTSTNLGPWVLRTPFWAAHPWLKSYCGEWIPPADKEKVEKLTLVSVELTIPVLVPLLEISLDFSWPLDEFFMLNFYEHLDNGGVEGWQHQFRAARWSTRTPIIGLSPQISIWLHIPLWQYTCRPCFGESTRFHRRSLRMNQTMVPGEVPPSWPLPPPCH
ncbi:hypothetical protein Acr_17g0006850 [Actinidia rufa]|uniref:CCHC-type domain-containing protein n=1 Tax=Actinidia rufa TaxID=165716 RepID=A0A7J0G2V6_9ERIC|nr:hypothetical protein Acr_17g0006850 [Actinidia rufa]